MVAVQKAAGVDLFLLEMVGDPVLTRCVVWAVQAKVLQASLLKKAWPKAWLHKPEPWWTP